jgi:hypothetical protein
MVKAKAQAPKAELLYTCSVDTVLGPRDVRLYWGDVATVPQKDAVAIVSSNVYQRHVTGQAWRALLACFPSLKGTEAQFKTLIEADPDSAVWPLSDVLASKWEKLSADPKFKKPSVLVSPEVGDERLRRVFVLRTLAQHQTDADMEDYKLGLRACFVALCAQESYELAEEHQEHQHGPYDQVVLAPLAASQQYPVGALLETLIMEGCKWLKASPRWHSVDIAYWKEGVTKSEARGLLVDALGEVTLDGGEGTALELLFRELTTRVIGTIKSLPKGKDHDELRHALGELRITLERDDRTVTEIGTGAGRLAEALVNWLSQDLKMARPKDFCSGIEALGARSSRKGNKKDKWLSGWFKSYLHTLRILRNESAHSQSMTERVGQFPSQLDADDLTVLAASLKRVLVLHEKMMRPT